MIIDLIRKSRNQGNSQQCLCSILLQKATSLTLNVMFLEDPGEYDAWVMNYN